MTFNILFFTISLKKRIYTLDEIKHELEIKRISDELTDRKCSLRQFM